VDLLTETVLKKRNLITLTENYRCVHFLIALVTPLVAHFKHSVRSDVHVASHCALMISPSDCKQDSHSAETPVVVLDCNIWRSAAVHFCATAVAVCADDFEPQPTIIKLTPTNANLESIDNVLDRNGSQKVSMCFFFQNQYFGNFINLLAGMKFTKQR